MEFPDRIGVMILSGCNLFPGAVQPLFIFEPRYRAMLADALEGHRLFCVAMQRPEADRESPCPTAGLGVIRAAVKHPNGTSNLIVQGLARVRLGKIVQSRPYRVQLVEPIPAAREQGQVVDALIERVLDLVDARLRLGARVPLETFYHLAGGLGGPGASVEQCVRALRKLADPGMLADLVTVLLLSEAEQRQMILEHHEVEPRLQQLVQFLVGEVNRARKVGKA